MHLNYYFLRQVSAVLQKRLVGFEVASCFSQEKEEMVLIFRRGEEEFIIKAILTPRFSSLSFPENFHRARANSANLFPDLLGAKVEQVVQHQNERSFHVAFTGGLVLLFKLFGNRSNVILYRDQEPVDLFKSKLRQDLLLRPEAMSRHLQQDFPAFTAADYKVSALYPTFGDLPQQYLRDQGFDQLAPEAKWVLLQTLVRTLETPGYYLTKVEGANRLSLLPLGEVRQTFTDPLEALKVFGSVYLSELNFDTLYKESLLALQKRLESGSRLLAEAEIKLGELQHDVSYSQTADLIMANLSFIPAGAAEVEVFDFYSDQKRMLKLKPTETPQKYAERLYRKGKNRQIEIKLLEEKILRKTDEVLAAMEQLAQLQETKDMKALKIFLKSLPATKENTKGDQEQLFREFTLQGFKIWVGKNARNNDVLTQRHTFKEDLWLHAKDVSGSHVVVKYQSGKTYPEQVVEAAAELAAYYSKRKNDSLCPVLYTPKKYVRKRKGAEPGAVVVEREKVILVVPRNPFEQRF